MAEKQMDHRHAMERKVVDSSVESIAKGRNSAILVSGMFIAASCYLGHLGYPAYAIGGIGATLVSLGGIYVWGNKTRQQEREHKKEIQNRTDEPPSENDR